jgi:hypothetical protein
MASKASAAGERLFMAACLEGVEGGYFNRGVLARLFLFAGGFKLVAPPAIPVQKMAACNKSLGSVGELLSLDSLARRRRLRASSSAPASPP